jgi:hypothetical protein
MPDRDVETPERLPWRYAVPIIVGLAALAWTPLILLLRWLFF